MNHIIELQLGDTSGDGHLQTDSLYIKCNYPAKTLWEYYEKSNNLLNFDLINNVACEYEENQLSEDQIEILSKHLDLKSIIGTYKESLENLWIDSYSNLVLKFIKITLVDLEYEFIRNPNDTMDIGGYGLYH